MKDNELVKLSIYIITEFYNHNLEPYFSYLDDDVLWVGPYDSLAYKGKQSLVDNAKNEPKEVRFSINSFNAISQKISTNTTNILLQYKVYAFKGVQELYMQNQQMTLCWVTKTVSEDGEKVRTSRIKMVHVSNVDDIDSSIANASLEQQLVAPPQILLSNAEDGHRIEATSLDRSTFFFLPATISYIESCDSGRHTKLHLIDRDVVCINKITDFAERYPQYFIKIHESYLVNPGYVSGIRRFAVDIVNGPSLPIPEKKYTQIKEALSNYFK